MSKRQIVIYSNDADAPADLQVGEVVPVVRGDGPREGDLMGMATVIRADDELKLELNPVEKANE